MKFISITAVSATLLSNQQIAAFVSVPTSTKICAHPTTTLSAATLEDVQSDSKEMKRQQLKQALLGRIGGQPPSYSDDNLIPVYDPVLADPLTKESLRISVMGPILGGGGGSSSRSSSGGRRLSLRPLSVGSDRVFEGRTNTYINLLEPVSSSPISTSETDEGEEEKKTKTTVSSSPILSSLLTFTPPQLRSMVANVTNSDVEYIPMRDLFTSPSVSFAYERGWRQGFAAAGFPGADEEFELAKEYFEPVIAKKKAKGEDDVLVDMSCATGLFTRRFAKSNEYTRVIACDYSDSMLTEARRRIRADPEIATSSTKLDLVRCDVGQIPMKTNSVDVFHAGAAMHCWPEIERSLKEIHRVLTPGGRYFATTFLGNYFANIERAQGSDIDSSMQAFQLFPSADFLRDLLLDAGFEKDKVDVEVVGRGCVIMRCEK